MCESNRAGISRTLQALMLAGACTAVASCGGDEGPTTSEPTNTAPVADAGADQTVSAAVPVRLDGSASSDADGDSISYAWSIASAPGGSAATVDDATAAAPTFVPDVAGQYTVELVVHDGTEDSSADGVAITAEDNSAQETIGAAGGAVTSADGVLELSIPAGALDADTDIRITMVPVNQFPAALDSLDPGGLVLYDLQPAGTTFDVPATLTLASPGAVAEVEDTLSVAVPFLFTISESSGGAEGQVLSDVVVAAERGASDALVSASIEHFSTLVDLAVGLNVRATGVPSEIPATDEFNATVEVMVNSFDITELTALSQTDASEAPIAPAPGFDSNFSATAGSGTSTNAYECTTTGPGTYQTDVDVTYSLDPGLLELMALVFVPVGQPVAASRVRLSAPVDCLTPPAPPPSTFTPLALSALEAITVLALAEGTVYGVAAAGGGTLFDDNGSVLDELGGDEPFSLYGITGETDLSGNGTVIGYGPDGLFGRDPEDPMTLNSLDLNIPGITDNSTSVTDGILIIRPPEFGGGGSEPPGRYVFAQFEDRNILFLDQDENGEITVVPELAEAFFTEGTSVFGTDRPVSVWVGPDGFDADHPMLVLTISENTSGHLNLVRLVDGVAELEAVEPDAFFEPRKLRCDNDTGICAMTSFQTGTYGGFYIFKWDGADGIIRLSHSLTFAPVGIDIFNTGTSVFMVGTDTRRFINGAYRYRYRVLEYDLNGARINNGTFLTSEECVNPFHAVMRRRVPEYNQVLLSCQGDESTPGQVMAATFEW